MAGKNLWNGTLGDLIKAAKESEEIKAKLGANAAKRLFDAIVKYGVDERKALDGRTIRTYKFFADTIFGKGRVIDELMNVIKVAASGADVGHNLLIMVGPPGGGKSTIAQKLREALEGVTAYTIKDCPLRENPLKMIPLSTRKKVCEELGIRMPIGDICPWCDQQYDETCDDWENIPAVEYVFNERKGRGISVIGTAQDPQEVDISELVGSQNLSKAMQMSESDPRSWDAKKSALFKANNGILEIIEILKLDAKFHKAFSTICQEAKIDIPGIGVVTGIDALIIGHTNEAEYKQFETLRGGEWLRRRVIIVRTPHVLDYRQEERVQRKLVDSTTLKNIHQSPYTYECLALLGIMSRMVEDEKIELLQKATLYARERFENDEDLDIKLEDIVKTGQDKGEGESGLDSTTLNKMILFALGRTDKCLFVLDLLKEVNHFLDSGSDATTKDRAAELNERIPKLLIGLKEYYTDKAYKDVVKCFLYEHVNDIQTLFYNYIQAVVDFIGNKSREAEKAKADEKAMRRIEEKLGISESQKREHRLQVLADQRINKSEDLSCFPNLKKAIEDIILEDVGPTIKLTLISDNVKERVEQTTRRTALVAQLIEAGYCGECAKAAIELAAKKLREKA